MGFFDNVGEALFGTKTKAAGGRAQNEGLEAQKMGIANAKEQFRKAAEDSKAANAEALTRGRSGFDSAEAKANDLYGKSSAEAKDLYGSSKEKAESLYGSNKAEAEAANAAADKQTNALYQGASDRTGALADQAGARAGQYAKGQDESMGANAADFMGKANAAAQGQATESAKVGTMQATREALKAARSSGLNKGQSALAAAQQAGNAYTNQYQGGLEAGRSQYQQNAAQFGNQANISQQAQAGLTGQQSALAQGQAGQIGAANQARTAQSQDASQGLSAQQAAAAQNQAALGANQATNQANLGANMAGDRSNMETGIAAQQANAALGAASGEANAVNGMASGMTQTGANMAGQAQNTANATIGTIGQIAGVAAMSDERSKEEVTPSNSLKDILKQIKPVDFNYKPGMGANDGQRRTGIIAQDLLGTPLQSAVKEDENGMKVIDSGELSPAVLNLVLQLAGEVKALRGKK